MRFFAGEWSTEKIKLLRVKKDRENVKKGSKIGRFVCTWEKHVRSNAMLLKLNVFMPRSAARS